MGKDESRAGGIRVYFYKNVSKIYMKISSIKLKFAIIFISVSLISFGIAALLSTQWMAEEILGDFDEKAALIRIHIIHDLEESMDRKTHGEVFRTLDIYKGYKEVEEVRFFDLKGKDVFTEKPGQPDVRVEEVLRTGAPVRFNKIMNQRNVVAFVTPIQNKTECHQCHEKGDSIRGALLLSLNKEGMERYIGEKRQRFYLFFGLIAIGVCFASIFAVNRFFINPLKAVQKGTEAIKGGDLQYQVPTKSNDEIGVLAENFNLMTENLQSVFKELEKKNKQIEEQLQLVSHSQKEWQETFNCITDPIAIMANDCTILRANQAFQKVFEEAFKIETFVQQNGILNKKCEELFGTCLLSDCPHKITVAEKRAIFKEIRGPRTGKIYEISMFPYYSQHRDFIGSIAILKDITEKKEDEMRSLLRERLAALGQIISGVVHEINNPLATIGISAEGLLERVKEGRYDQQLFENYLGIIGEEIHRSRKITNSMLSYVRGGETEKEEINIHEVLDNTLEMLSFQGRLNNIELLKDYRDEMKPIRGNEGELRQVFLAVINNALEAMEGKGRLKLETENREKEVSVRISDTGPGISSKIADRIFIPFITTRSEKGGTGLGLYIAKKIIQEHNGSIEVLSKEGEGATFSITLPT
jgi:signal transduction histidine kinase